MKKFGLLFSSLAFTACTEVRVINPNPHVEVPEIRGDRGLTIAAQGGGGHTYRSTDEGGKRPPDISSPAVIASADLDARVTYSPVEPLDLGIELYPLGDSAGGAIVAKLMLSGAGTRAAQPGDVPIAIYGKLGGAHSHSYGDQQTTFGPGGYNWSGTMDSAFLHAGASAGYRISEHAMIYGGAAFGHYLNRTEIDQDTNTSGTPAAGGVYKANDYGDAITIGPGAMFNWKYVQFYFGGEYTYIQYHNTPVENDFTFNAGVLITPR